MKSERILSGQGQCGPGGLKCHCCGGADGGRKGRTEKRAVRKFVRGLRRKGNKRAISEGRREMED